MRKLLGNKLFLQGVLGVVLILMVYMTFGLSTVSYKGTVFEVAHIVMCLLTMLIYYLFDNISKKNDCYEQIYKLNVVLTVVTLLLLISGTVNLFVNGLEYTYFSKLIFALSFIIVTLKGKNCISLNKINIKSNMGLILFIVAALVLMYNPYIFSFRWDGLLYHETFATADLFRISSLGFYGHIAEGSGFPVALLQSLFFGNTELTIYVINALTLVVGGLSFYGIIRKLVPGCSNLLYTILTGIYIFSPWALGMSGYASIDFFCANWFLPVIYFTITRQYFLQVVTGLFYAMTKEPAIIIYGALCVGILVMDWIANKSKVFRHLRYYGMAAVALIWLITLKFMGIWSMPSSGASVSTEHIKGQAGILFVLNWGWLIWVLVILGGIILLCHKERDESFIPGLKSLVPMTVSLVGFVLFCFIYSTAPNPRYTDIVPLCGYIYLAFVLLNLAKCGAKKISMCIASVVMIVVLMSSYFSFDPVSGMFYLKAGEGENRLYTADNKTPSYGDGAVYNKQGIFMEGSYNMAVNDAVQNNMQLLISGKGNEAYYLDGMIGIVKPERGEYELLEEYFDTKRNIRKIHANENTVTYDIGVISDFESIKAFPSNGTCLYVYCDEIGKTLADDIIQNMNVIQEKEYPYMGFTLHGIVFQRH